MWQTCPGYGAATVFTCTRSVDRTYVSLGEAWQTCRRTDKS